MIQRISAITPLPDYMLSVLFDDGRRVLYDVKDDIKQLPGYDLLKTVAGLFEQVQLDESRTCVFWNDQIDLPSHTIYEYGNSMPISRLSKEDCIKGYQDLYGTCRERPLAAMLLPVIFTVYSTDEAKLHNVYSYLRYKNRRLSREDQKQVHTLFLAIAREVEIHFPEVKKFVLPVFLWEKLEDRFCSHISLSDEDAQNAKQCLAHYRMLNGLSKPEEQVLKKYSYGEAVRSLAKLCNLNVCAIMYNLENPTLPAKVKKPYSLLKEGKLLPLCINLYWGNYKGNFYRNSYDDYFGDLCKPVTGNSLFSYLALLRYYRLP